MSRYDDIDTQYSRTEIRKVRRLEEPEGSFWPWGVLPWLGILALSVFSCTAVQESTESYVERELADRNLNWVEAEASGRTVTLTGRLPSEDAENVVARVNNQVQESDWMAIPFQSIDIIQDFKRPATTNTIVVPPPAPETSASVEDLDWSFALSDKVLRLTGEVPDAQTLSDIIAAAEASVATPAVEIIDDKLEARNVTAPAGYSDVAVAAVRAVSYCDEGVVSFEKKVLKMDCELPRRLRNPLRQEITAPLAYGRLGTLKLKASEDVAACEGSLSTLLSEAKIEFATGSSTIDAASLNTVMKVADAAKTCPGTLRIEGHTDISGNDEDNNTLSAERAEAVRAELVKNGVNADRLVSRGFGSRQPTASNATREGRARNRRIEIKVVGPNE